MMVANNNHGGDTVLNQTLEKVTVGPAKGSYFRKDDTDKYNEIYDWISTNISAPAKVCYFGKNVLLYLMSPYIEVSPPQTFMDYSDDQVLIDFYKKDPGKYPDMIIIDISPSAKREVQGDEWTLVDN